GMLHIIPGNDEHPQAEKFYYVQAGDTLSGIAQRAYNNSSQPYWTAIYLANQDEIGNDPNAISRGEPLYIPPIASPPREDSFYIVQAGDSLWSIAQQAYNHRNVVQALYNVNKKVIGDDPNLILPGQILFLEQGLLAPGEGGSGGGVTFTSRKIRPGVRDSQARSAASYAIKQQSITSIPGALAFPALPPISLKWGASLAWCAAVQCSPLAP